MPSKRNPAPALGDDTNKPIVFAITNDQHAGSRVALCPPVIRDDDGGEYRANKIQTKLRDCWDDFWERVAEHRRMVNGVLWAGFNGDAFEGAHHGTTQIVSANLNAQSAVWSDIVKRPLGLKPSRIFVVRGTPAHVGESASAEERMAEGMCERGLPVFRDPENGNASAWHFRLRAQGVYLDLAHHGRTGQREHTRMSAAVLHAHDIYLAHLKAGDIPPDLVLRAHHHRFNDSHDACPTRVFTNGCWQMSTAFAHKVVPDTLPDIGGVIVTIHKGEYDLKKIHYPIQRGPIVELDQ